MTQATFCLATVLDNFAPVCKGAIISQLRVWPFPFAIIVAIGERSQNPGHLLTGAYNYMKLCLKSLAYYNIDRCCKPFSNRYLPKKMYRKGAYLNSIIRL